MSRLRQRAAQAIGPVLLVAGLAAPGFAALPVDAPSSAGTPISIPSVVTGAPASPRPEAPPAFLLDDDAVAAAAAAAEEVLPTMPLDDFDCRMPRVELPVSEACDIGLPYPACTWQIPEARNADRIYAVWRNTSEEHRSARPGLVSLALAVASEYTRRYPGEVIALGDLDAPGPRHETHDKGHDIDMYLPGQMEVENLGGGELAENYAALTPLEKRMAQARVETLARILAACSGGRVRIFYNDPEVRARFQRWYDARGLSSPFGAPMQPHNDLHRFHFHVTVPDDLDPLPLAPPERDDDPLDDVIVRARGRDANDDVARAPAPEA